MTACEARRGGGMSPAADKSLQAITVAVTFASCLGCRKETLRSWEWTSGPSVVCYCDAVLVALHSSVITYYYPAVITSMLHLFIVIGATGAFERSRRLYAYCTRSNHICHRSVQDMPYRASSLDCVRQLVLIFCMLFGRRVHAPDRWTCLKAQGEWSER